MKKYLALALTLSFVLGACATKDQVAQALKDNPEILAEAIKKNPTLFMDSVREAARADQENQMKRQDVERQAGLEKDFKSPRAVKVDDARILFGEVKAPITIVKYADFQCPACKMGFESLEEIKKKYGSQVRIVHKNIPLPMHKQAVLAAEIFESLLITDKAKAREFYKAAYQSQGSWRSDAELWKVAQKVGVNKAKIDQELKKGVVRARIQEDLDEHQKLGFEGTPAYMVNGVALYGAQPVSEFSAVIDRLLKK